MAHQPKKSSVAGSGSIFEELLGLSFLNIVIFPLLKVHCVEMCFYFSKGKNKIKERQILAGTHDKHNEESLMLFLQLVSFQVYLYICIYILRYFHHLFWSLILKMLNLLCKYDGKNDYG